MTSAVVLAAGASTRMGTQKLLLPLGGEPLVRRTVREVCAAGFDEVVVVLGHEHEKVREVLDSLPVRTTINEAYLTGMGSSFRAAVEHVAPDSAAAMFALGDQPLLAAKDYRRLLDTFAEQSPGIVCVRYGDVTAPPHLFGRKFFPELSKLVHGARGVLEQHRDETVVLQFPPDLLQDIDTPDDYERVTRRLSSE